MGLHYSGINAFDISRYWTILSFYWWQTENNAGTSKLLQNKLIGRCIYKWLKLQEYFLADSGVSIYPVSFSLMASFMSAITLVN